MLFGLNPFMRALTESPSFESFSSITLLPACLYQITRA